MDLEMMSIRSWLRVPLQVAPVGRTLVGTALRENADGVSASLTPREFACHLAASSACGHRVITGGFDACYDGVMGYCMGGGGTLGL